MISQMPEGYNVLDEEVVCITRRRGKQYDDGDDVVLKQTSCRRVERPVASPEFGEGQYTLTTELLNNYSKTGVSNYPTMLVR